MWRRTFLLAPLAAALPGCGFEPMLAPERGAGAPSSPGDPTLARELAAVRVALIPERNGQVMRRTLQRRLEGSAPGIQARYELQTGLIFNTELLGYRRDGAITRVRYLASAPWVLTEQGQPPVVLARNTARAAPDAYNIPDLQFFASDTSREAMERRLVEELSDQIFLGVAAALGARRRVAAAAGGG